MTDRILSHYEMLARAGATEYPELRMGQVVDVLYSTRPPERATVDSDVDRHGWVWVTKPVDGGPVRFQVLASCCEPVE